MRAYMAIYGPHGSSNGAYMGAYMGHMGAAIGHTYAHTWPYMGAYMGHMGAAIGHACAHTWAIYGGIHGPHGSCNGACMRAYMAIYGSSPIGRAGRKGTAGNPFPSLDQGRELPRAYPCPVPQRIRYIKTVTFRSLLLSIFIELAL